MKKFIIILLILALLAGLYVYLIHFGRDGSEVISKQVDQVSVDGVGVREDKTPVSGVGTFAELRAQGSDLECQVIQEKPEGTIEGTLFLSGGSVRGDFVVPADELGGTIVSSMIVGGDSTYVWSTIDGETFGFKSDTETEAAAQLDAKEPVPMDATVQYTCVTWDEVDGSVFVPPATIKFRDLNAVMEAGMEYGTLP
jgi:hypothetical protein